MVRRRLVKTLHPDLGDLNDFDNMLLRERLAVYALSGWCDPAIHRINDVFIEDALPAMRWRAALEQSDGGEVIVIPEISDQTTLYRALEPLYRRLARATLNGDDGVFADHKVDEELYALRSNPHVCTPPTFFDSSATSSGCVRNQESCGHRHIP